MPRKSKPQRKPGRPRAKHAPNSRAALIEAARDLFARHSFSEVSTKQIAAAAGVNSAMIHYHFKDKSGLLEATFREALQPVVEEVLRLSAAPAAERPLQRFFEIYMRTLAANPWLPQMAARHVLPEGGQLQKVVVTELASRVGPMLATLIARAQAQHALRADLDPVLATLSAVSLAVFPFLSLPVTRRVFSFVPDEAFVERLVEHTTTLFYRGAHTPSSGASAHGR